MMTLSGLHDTARSLAVYASQPGLPRHHARLAPGCWPALPDGAGYPQGPVERFPLFASPFPELSWRTKVTSQTLVRLAFPFGPSTDSVTMNSPADLYRWAGWRSAEVSPSPKS